MILHSTFRMAGNNENFLNPAGQNFLYNVLNSRLIYNRQHLLGHGLCFRKKTGTKPCEFSAFKFSFGFILSQY